MNKLSPSISRVCFLQILNLRNTGLKNLPSQIVTLKYLTDLDISENQFSCFPDEIFSLVSLRSLNVSSTLLEILSPKLGQLDNLLNLDLSHNRLRDLPSFFSLRLLNQLDVSDNRLSELHESIFSLPHLRFLYSSNNPFKAEQRLKIKKRFGFK